jgi:hypothetical protein
MRPSKYMVILIIVGVSVARRHGGEGAYEQPSKHSFVVYLTAQKLV